MPKKPAQKPVIGWREWVAFPDLGVKHIKAKVDTGARSSAIHAYDLEITRRGNKRFANFLLHPYQRTDRPTIRARAEVIDERSVRSSNGKTEKRPVILTKLVLGEQEFEIELTLTRRDDMGFRLLLGRQAVHKRFLIDASKSFLTKHRRPKQVKVKPRKRKPARSRR